MFPKSHGFGYLWLFHLRKRLKVLRHLALLSVAWVDQYTISKLQMLPLLELHHIAGGIGELGMCAPEGVGGQEAVVSGVPAGGDGVLGVIEDRDADRFAV